jgi:hypothetical protein
MEPSESFDCYRGRAVGQKAAVQLLTGYRVAIVERRHSWRRCRAKRRRSNQDSARDGALHNRVPCPRRLWRRSRVRCARVSHLRSRTDAVVDRGLFGENIARHNIDSLRQRSPRRRPVCARQP